MNVTLSIDEAVLRNARERAETLGTTVDEMVSGYLAALASKAQDPRALVEEFERLSIPPRGNSRGWKFDRDEVHER